jgi:hypothetical protein
MWTMGFEPEGGSKFSLGEEPREKRPWFLSQMPTTSGCRDGEPSRLFDYSRSHSCFNQADQLFLPFPAQRAARTLGLSRKGGSKFSLGEEPREKRPWFLSQMPTTSRCRDGEPSRMCDYSRSHSCFNQADQLVLPFPAQRAARTLGSEPEGGEQIFSGRGFLVNQ